MSQLEPTEEELRAAKFLIENPIETFTPTRPQQQFLAHMNFVQVFSGANWAGKTAITMIKTGAILFGSHNTFLNYPHLRAFASKLRFRIVSTHASVEGAIWPEITRWWPKARYTKSKGARPFDSKIVTDRGSIGDLMTYDQDPDQFESVKLDLCIFDEPPPYKIFAATIARMRPGGIIMIGMTPLTGAGWLFDRLENPWMAKSWGITYADIESACTTHGFNGYLDHDAIDKKINEYDEEEREARITGKPMHLQGLVYKTFNPKTHVVEPFEIPADWPRYLIVDPHDRRPFAMLWAAVSPDEKIYIYDEWPNVPYHTLKTSSYRIADYANLIREREGNTPAKERIIDAKFGHQSKANTGGKSIRDLFDDEGLYFHDSYTDKGGLIEHGHQQVREYLALGTDGKPGLMLFSNCQNTIYSFGHYTWADPKRSSEASAKEKPKEDHKDFMDLVRYLSMEGPRYVPPTEETPPPPKWGQAQELGYGSDG